MPRRRISQKKRQTHEAEQTRHAQDSAEMATLQHDARSRLQAKLRAKRQGRQKAGQRPTPVFSDAIKQSTTSDDQRVKEIASWILAQLIRDNQQTVRSSASLCLLFHVDLLSEEGWIDGSGLGSSLEICLFKVNAGIYFISSDHMSGLKTRIQQGKQSLDVSPDNLLYVTNPTQHRNGVTGEIQFDLTNIEFVARDIPIQLVTGGADHQFALDAVHLPVIRQAMDMND
ncbi:MAG: hypothetical protein K0U52_00855 [Gammaproteobacteria bacterium]|nr:hypothetical protein [Gammaproteobacteria bacterium]